MTSIVEAGAASGDDASEPKRRVGFWLLMVGVVIMLAGALFGYDQGVISGALHGMQAEFDLSTSLTEVITSGVTLGALVGALIAGLLADRIGRRRTILIAALLFCVGAVLEAAAPNTNVLVVGRFTVGFGVGVASVAAPLYAAEMAPSRLRGRFISTYQLAITIGIFVAYAVDQVLTNSDNWRLMLGVSAVPAVLLIIAIVPMTDTTRWLVKVGRREDAVRALHRIDPDGDTDAGIAAIEDSLADDADQASWGEVFGRAMRRPLVIGVGLAIFQQITGINAIIYYANEIFGFAGFSTPQEQAAATTWAIGAVNVLATLVAVAYVDHFGRKPLLLMGLVGMGTSLAVVGACFVKLDDAAGSGESMAGTFMLVALVVFIASFAFSLGPVVWTIINEIFPNRVRGRAVAVATAVNWGAAYLVSRYFLTLIEDIGKPATFWLFAFFSLCAFVFIKRIVPETKGRTLEEIEAMWEPKLSSSA
jgi:SP family galactose:H+ symporter-like MFS transporter